MRATARPVLVALVLAVLLGTLGTQAIAFSDYEVEAEPAAVALAAGHLGRFAALAPAYGGSLLLSAPFGWVASVLGFGTDLGLYRALVLPALLGAAALGVALWRRREAVGGRGAGLALALAVANPLSLRALELGHPEEIVGGVLCVAAVLLALRDRAVVAGVLLGLAGANKPWALLAVAPVLLALETGRRRCALTAGAVGAALLAPLALSGTLATSTAAITTNDTPIFQPWQVFWFFGDHGAPVMGLLGEKVGFRTAVGWAQAVSHPAVIIGGLAVGLAGWSRRRRDGALALLALVFLTRCALDTWNTVYYVVPFVFALLAHEVVARGRGPVGTLVTTVALWVAFELLHPPDVQAAAFLLIAATAWASLALAVFAPDQAAALTRAGRARAARTLPTLLPDRQPHLQPDPDASGGAWATFAQARSTIGR